MKILITGGAGFIGSAIVPRLLEEGHAVGVIDNLSFGRRELLAISDSCFFQADIRDAEQMESIVAEFKPEVLIHLAAIHFIPYCNEHPFESSDVNIRGTINLVEACKRAGTVKKFLFASTAAVYPISDVAVGENFSVNPLDIYGLSKLAGERICHEFFLETNTDTIVCRFFNAFGPNETNPHLIPEIETQLKQGLRTIKLGNLSPKRDFIHTHDMANAVNALLNLREPGYQVFNLGRGIEYSVTEIVAAFERQLGEKITVEVDERRVRKVERMHLLADVSKLKTKTGWEPKWGIDEGIRHLLEN